MDWFWWVFIFFMAGGFAKVADTARTALRTRHERKMERLETARQERQELAAAQQAAGAGVRLHPPPRQA